MNFLLNSKNSLATVPTFRKIYFDFSWNQSIVEFYDDGNRTLFHSLDPLLGSGGTIPLKASRFMYHFWRFLCSDVSSVFRSSALKPFQNEDLLSVECKSIIGFDPLEPRQKWRSYRKALCEVYQGPMVKK